MMMGHWRVVRSHNQWRKGHEFHAEVTDRNVALQRAGFLRLLGGDMAAPVPDPVPEVPVKPARHVANPNRRARGVQVQPVQDGEGHVCP
jgi:hypothetical protein